MASPFRKDPEGEPAQTAAFNAPRPITAAAVRINLNDKIASGQLKQRQSGPVRAWQSEAWEYYDAIAEIKYAFSLVGSVVSRIRLYAAVIADPADAPIEIQGAPNVDEDLQDAAVRAIARLNSAYGGQAGLLRDAALNLLVAGECFLVQVPERIGTGIPESWDIRSIDEFQIDKAGNYSLAPHQDLVGAKASSKGIIQLPTGAFVGRIWKSHPRFTEDPDSSLKSLLDLCAELLLINRSFRGIERSRLNAGALYIPDGLSTAGNPDPDLYLTDDEDIEQEPSPEEVADSFEEELIEAMTTPIEDEASASSVVPLLIRGPAELGKEIRFITFERSYDQTILKRSEDVLDRILQGLDVPKDIVTGLANVKYTNAQQIDDSLYRAHIEPMMLMISDALTQVYLRPYLKSQGWADSDVARLVVWYDPSAVATRNDRAADADSGFEKMVLSAAAWRSQHGFSDADAPDQTEIALRLLLEKGLMTPELTESLLKVVSPNIMDAVRAQNQAGSVGPVPGNVQQALSGGDPTAAAAPAAPDTSATPDASAASSPAAPDSNGDSADSSDSAAPSGSPVEPGQDGPEFTSSAPSS